MLTPDEERALFVALAEHDGTAFERLVQANLRLVLAVAARFQKQGLDLPDLVGLGNLALLRLLRSFSAEHGVRFASYAVPRLKGVMLNAIRDYGRMVRLPRRQHEALARVRKIEERMLVEGYRTDTAKLAKLANVEEAEYVAWLNADSVPVSLDYMDDDEASPLAMLLPESAALKQMSLPVWQCLRCGHAWTAKTTIKPVSCARCKSRVWDRPRKTEARPDSKKEEAMATFIDPMSGEELEDYDYLDLYPDVTAAVGDTTPALAVPQAPPKGKCEECANYMPGVRYCSHSGHTIGTDKALKWCVPAAKGYIPKSARS